MAKKIQIRQFAIQYPPDYDGELDIEVQEKESYGGAKGYTYTFTHSSVKAPPEWDAWNTLVAAAKAILAQDERMKTYG